MSVGRSLNSRTIYKRNQPTSATSQINRIISFSYLNLCHTSAPPAPRPRPHRETHRNEMHNTPVQRQYASPSPPTKRTVSVARLEYRVPIPRFAGRIGDSSASTFTKPSVEQESCSRRQQGYTVAAAGARASCAHQRWLQDWHARCRDCTHGRLASASFAPRVA